MESAREMRELIACFDKEFLFIIHIIGGNIKYFIYNIIYNNNIIISKM